jgi:XTP/dITP diphosphohydrolase
MDKIVLASGNKKKLAEMQEILEPLGMQVLQQSEFDVPEAEETGVTFVENALIKARNAARHTGLPAIADDSGIAVDALGGAPGVFSARFAGPDATDERNNALLMEKLEGVPEAQRTARYYSLIVMLRHADDPVPLICEGSWEGRVATEAKGDGGFGYDPYFYVPELGKHAAELPADEKNRISHRGKALGQLMKQLAGRTSDA